MHQILDYVYIGSSSETTLDDITKHKIAAIVCGARDHPMSFSEQVEYLYVPLVDDLTDNILRYVDTCHQFMHKHVQERRNVYVHCVAGVSRSVALVTGYIMKDRNTSLHEAYGLVKSKYPRADSGENFMEQLELYADRFTWDMTLNTQTHRLYRSQIGMFVSEKVDDSGMASATCRYICKKCKQCLFLDSHVVQETETTRPLSANVSVECMQWMKDQVIEHKGHITCVGCSCKLGSYDWTGPHFVITKSKVDQMPLHCRFKGDEFPKTLF